MLRRFRCVPGRAISIIMFLFVFFNAPFFGKARAFFL